MIISGDRSSHHRNVIVKALNKAKVPFDAFYQTTGVSEDNFFTYDVIQKDLNSLKHQILFVTSTNFSLSSTLSEKVSEKINQSDP